MTMKGYPRIIRDKGEMWMPKETFFNLSNAKKQRIDDLLLEIFCSQHISQVKVSEIVDKMGMSRGAFYKYFQDLEDAYLYTIKSSSHIVHQDILKFISENKQHFFLGVEKYLEWCCDLDHESIYWQRLYLLTQRNDQQTTKRRELSADSPMNEKWLELLRINHFSIQSSEEAVSFLYFSMTLVMNTLTDLIANNWTKEELLKDFRYKSRWIAEGIQ